MGYKTVKRFNRENKKFITDCCRDGTKTIKELATLFQTSEYLIRQIYKSEGLEKKKKILLPLEKRREIKQALDDGYSIHSLSRYYGVTRVTIRRIMNE